MSTIGEIIKHLQGCDPATPAMYVLFTEDDILPIVRSEGYAHCWTREDSELALWKIDAKCDWEAGLSWYTIEFWIGEVARGQGYKRRRLELGPEDLEDRPEDGWFPSEGWAVFTRDGREDYGVVERIAADIDETGMTDDDALLLAEARGLRFDDSADPYRVTNWAEWSASQGHGED